MKRLFIAAALAAIVLTPATARAARQDFTLYNMTSVSFSHVYFAAAYTDDPWNRTDLLGQYTLNPNYHIGLWINDTANDCEFDFKAVTSDGTRYETTADVCKESSVYIYDKDLYNG
jgi:hypothetical protein